MRDSGGVYITRREVLVGGIAGAASFFPLIGAGEVTLLKPDTERKQGSKQRIADMEIKRVGSQPSAKGPPEYFTGTVRIDSLFQAPDPAQVSSASVTFEPGAR